MTIRNLDALFKPKSIALIGASNKPASIGAVLGNNLFSAGFKGPVMPVDPKHKKIAGRKVFPDVAGLPEPVDLGVICTPAAAVPGIVGALGRLGARAALIDAVETLALAKPPKGDRLTILTNGGGIGVLATDALIDLGGRLAPLSDNTIAALSQVLPPTWSHGNPIDIIGDATGSRYADALAVLMKAPGVDGILAMHCPTAVTSTEEAAKAVVDAVPGQWGPLLLTSWVGDGAARQARRLFAERRIPTYDTPEQAVRAFMYLVRYRRSQELLMETPPSIPKDFSPDGEKVKNIVNGVLDNGRSWLTEYEAKQVLSAYGIPVVATQRAESPEEAAEQAAEIGGPVALKILSSNITHKSDVGGVALDVVGSAAVLETAKIMLVRLDRSHPEARQRGFTVQPMMRRPGAYELIIGMSVDPQFGPEILAGQGGVCYVPAAPNRITSISSMISSCRSCRSLRLSASNCLSR